MSIAWLTGLLPPSRPIERRSEADYYGASELIANALGYKVIPRSIASWKHGVSYEQRMTYPDLLLTEGNRATRHLVANEWQRAAIGKAGYPRTHAVGAPFIYANPSGATRLPRSLLVMPAHRIQGSRNAFDEEDYASRIEDIRGRFGLIVACISPTCARQGSWTTVFEKLAIPWLVGADSTDGNALRRMRCLFDVFDFMTTNTLGSHVAYAAYSGCRVSIWGKYAQYELDDVKGIPWYEKRWARLAELNDCYSESHVRMKFPALFCDPWESEMGKEWADPYVGHGYKRSASEIAQLLGWNLLGQGEALLHRAARECMRIATGASRRFRHLFAG